MTKRENKKYKDLGGLRGSSIAIIKKILTSELPDLDNPFLGIIQELNSECLFSKINYFLIPFHTF